MSWTLDIIIVLIIGLTIYFAAKNGFVKTAISASSFIIAIALTAAFATPLAEVIKQTPLSITIRNATEDRIEDILLDGSYEIKSLVVGESDEFNKLLSVAGIDIDDLESYSRIDTDKAAYNLAVKISEPIIHTIAMAVAIVAIYIGTRIVLMIVAFILDQIFRLPVFNKLGGIIVGVVLALIRVCLFCFIAGLLIKNADFLGNEFISNLVPEKTLLFKFFNEIDIFSFFM